MRCSMKITPRVHARVLHADGSVTDLGDLDRPTLRTRWNLHLLKRRQKRALKET